MNAAARGHLLVLGAAFFWSTSGALVKLAYPVLNPIWTFLVVGERPGPFALLGGSIILGSVAFQALRARRA